MNDDDTHSRIGKARGGLVKKMVIEDQQTSKVESTRLTSGHHTSLSLQKVKRDNFFWKSDKYEVSNTIVINRLKLTLRELNAHANHLKMGVSSDVLTTASPYFLTRANFKWEKQLQRARNIQLYTLSNNNTPRNNIHFIL